MKLTTFLTTGKKTWDRFEMRIHKRVIDLYSPSDILKEIVSLSSLFTLRFRESECEKSERISD
jgi:ribosomal protein S10